MSQLNLIPENKQLSATRQALCYALGIWQHTNQHGSCPGEYTIQKKECRIDADSIMKRLEKELL